MHEENEVKNRILVKAEEVFFQFGYSRVTMEEIASELGISKKTLYKFFSNKEHLMKELILKTKCEVASVIDSIIEDSELEFTVKLQKLLTYLGMQSGKFHNPLMVEMKKNYPDIYNEVKEFRRKNSHEKLLRLIDEGISQGILRNDVNLHVAAMMYVNAIHNLLGPEAVDKLDISPEVVFKEIIKILFEGIFTVKGRETFEINEKILNTKENI
jgi:AcrR family transcriptional regulator